MDAGSTYLLRVLQATIRLLRNPLVRLLENFWREHPADLLVSVIPHFNRQICESWTNIYPGRPFVTLITDLADFPPHFGSSQSRNNTSLPGRKRPPSRLAFWVTITFISFELRNDPASDFYVAENYDALELRKQMGLRADLATAIVLFAGTVRK